jgi:hypothetical protein
MGAAKRNLSEKPGCPFLMIRDKHAAPRRVDAVESDKQINNLYK